MVLTGAKGAALGLAVHWVYGYTEEWRRERIAALVGDGVVTGIVRGALDGVRAGAARTRTNVYVCM